MLLSGFAVAQADEGGYAVPSLTIYRREIPDNEAMAFLQKMGVGWNLGNTFDAYKQGWNANADEMTVEKSWCGVYTTEDMIETLHQAGYTAIRMPTSWHDHVSGDDFTISKKWMDRVQQVVDWAIQRDMYVILNTHHDVDAQKYYYPNEANYDRSARYIQSVWTQIAARFRDYDEHLIFESMNEPRLTNHSNEWWFDINNADCVEAAGCINRLNQLFVDTVRESGGNNAQRYLMVPAYDASPDSACNDYFQLPGDKADNRIIVSVHAYTPYSFALQLDGGVDAFSLTNQSQTGDIIRFMNALYDRYIKNGIPVVIGEFGALAKGNNLQSRIDFTAFYVSAASARNLPVLWWDNNSFSGNGENFGLLQRQSCAFMYPDIVKATMQYGGYQKIPEKE